MSAVVDKKIEKAKQTEQTEKLPYQFHPDSDFGRGWEVTNAIAEGGDPKFLNEWCGRIASSRPSSKLRVYLLSLNTLSAQVLDYICWDPIAAAPMLVVMLFLF